jgi:urease accessory protein
MKPISVLPSRLLAAAVCAAPALALAHVGADPGHAHGAGEALATGFTHPFTGLDHLAAMVALGVWSALTARRVWLAPFVFAATLWVGAWLGLTGLALPAIEPVIATSLLVLGLLVATKAQLPAVVGAALAAGFALFHGAAHGTELAGVHAAWALAGMVAATTCLHVAGVVLGLMLRDRHVWLPRIAGAGVALFGAALLIA